MSIMSKESKNTLTEGWHGACGSRDNPRVYSWIPTVSGESRDVPSNLPNGTTETLDN